MRCLVCGGVGRQWAHDRGRDLLRCPMCGFAWVPQGVMRTPAGTSIYDDDRPIFFTDAQNDYYRDEVTIEAARAKVAWVEEHVPRGGRLLDVGANFGHFVSQAAAAFDAIGIEPSRSVVAWAREHIEAPLEVGSIERHNPGFERRFAAITLFDVVEHLADPREALARCRAYLAPHGRLFITTPDAGSPMARLLGRHWYYVDLIEHVSLFSAATLTRVLAESGFRVVARRTFGRSYRFSYIARRLRELASASLPLRLAAAGAAPLAWFPDQRVHLNFGDVIGVVADAPDEGPEA